MDTAVTVPSIECATLIIKAANRVVQIFEALQKREFTNPKKRTKNISHSVKQSSKARKVLYNNFGFLCVSLAILVPSEIERGQWTRDAKR